ncbi:HAD family hydrolase [Paenibacillus sp. JX-17]|uniref:HAD family hydrolase n=1 Tax=Paenibacillus lacisoli TaxID=3064525 RepID=A0ABT9CG95_9BACL|nr:HAD family hydrolase [Paenibacillus sp. JX-17]MDO7908300.1 HAD family hydrolase [Paenibacillus sp. JX-17]
MKAVVFDFDGLILDTETAWFRAFSQVLLEYNMELGMDVFSQGIGTHGSTLQDHIESVLEQPGIYREIAQKAYEIHKTEVAELQEREGVREYLESARQQGLKIGLATSSNREWIERFLQRLGLLDYFEQIRTSDDVELVKPDPELYVQVVAALGVEPHEALAFEDSLNGLKAAKAAGLSCVIVPNPVTANLAFEHYDLRLQSMLDQPLEQLIGQLNDSLAGQIQPQE